MSKSNAENAESLALEFLEAAASLERRLDRALSQSRGISFSEFRLLRALAAAHAGTATRVDLAAAVGLTPSAVTRALRPLEKLGYVVTEKSDRDARRSLATLTPAGVSLLGDARAVVRGVLADLPLAKQGAREIAAFHSLLQELTIRR